MALLDLSSDLSRFRSEVSREAKNTPEASKATNNKNFATFQPITEKLSSFSPTINKTQPKQLESKLGDTKLDDIRKFAMDNLLINSVSRYSEINTGYREESLGAISTEQVASRYNKLNEREFVSRLDKSNILVIKQVQGTNNTTSPVNITVNKNDSSDNITNPNVKIERVVQSVDRTQSSPNIKANPNDAIDNITNPNVQIEKSQLTFDKTQSSPNIKPNPNDAVDNITNPDIQIEKSQLTFDRTGTSPNIVVNKNDAVDNITNPNIQIDSIPLTFDRTKSSPNIVVNPNDTVDNVTNPNVQIEVSTQTIDRSKTSPNIVVNKNDANDNITNPDVEIQVPVQSIDRSKQTVNINADLVSPINNVIDPKIALDSTQLVFDRENQSPNIITETIKEGLVVDPNTKVFRMENGTLHLKDESKLNPDGRPIRFVTTSRLERRRPEQDIDVEVYDGESNQLKDNSRLNVDSVVKTNPSGRNEDPSKSKLSVVGIQAVNFFPDTNGVGFTTKPQKGVSDYTDTSEFSWKGNRNAAPATNFILDTNGVGFKTFVTNGETLYKNETSLYGFSKIPETDFFDVDKKNTSEGFKSFVTALQSAYQPDSSRFTWGGNKQGAPEVNYFDLNSTNTNAGFHKFAQTYESKYIPDSSRFDWDGNKQSAPQTNFFDVDGKNTTNGFERFTQMMVTRYVKDSSQFDFDGSKQDAPETNFFDAGGTYTSKGFEKFPQQLVSRYVRDVSVFGFAGASRSAPKTDFFPNTNGKGFTTFPAKLETEYVKDSSEFTFKGTTPTAIDFFPNDAADGFTNKIGELDSKYKKDVSRFTFKGTLPKPVDYFQNTNAVGFENKVQKGETKYKSDSSEFTFKGTTPKPVDFFPNTNGEGFTVKIGKNETKYTPDSSQFTFKGSSQEAPTVNYFQDTVNTGFTKFTRTLETEYKKDISRYTFAGTRQDAPVVDYFPNDSGKGFTTLVNSLETLYDEKTSKFTWVGSRQEAPAVDFLKLNGITPNAISGFDTLFNDVTSTKYSDGYSRFSIETSNNKSTVKNVPFTNFFGYRPSERTGFMVNMSTFDGTLYPIITPTLKYSDNKDTRFSVSSAREVKGGLSTTGLETYAPLSLGKRPWTDGTLAATLDNQVPNIKTKAPAGSYSNKYERGVKDNTDRKGYLTKWATKRNSPSPLDEQYSKYKLQNESVNREVAAFNQPFVVRGIQREGEVENQRWGFGVTFDDGIVRGGVVTQAERIAMDVVRLGKWTASIKGGLFNVKQLGLQAMNPAVDVDPKTPTSGIFGVSATLGYNPLTMLANVATARAGVHLARHGLFPFDSDYLNKYEKATINRESNLQLSKPEYKSFESLTTPGKTVRDPNGYNRLIGLMKELLPNSFQPTKKESLISGPPNLAAFLGDKEINRISSTFGGAQSYFGIGGTSIRKSSHPYLTTYITSPPLENTVPSQQGGINIVSQQLPQYLNSAKRNTFYAANENTYSDIFKSEFYDTGGETSEFFGILNALSYIIESGPRQSGKSQSPSKLEETIAIQKDTKEKIKNLNPFEPRYEFPTTKVERITDSNSKRLGSLLSEGLSDRVSDYETNPIKKYRTLAYNKLKKVEKGVAGRTDRFNDFRHDLNLEGTEAFVTKPGAARYDTQNLEDKFGFGRQGKVDAQRNYPFLTNLKYVSASNGTSIPDLKPDQEFRGDRINIIDYKRFTNGALNKKTVYELDNNQTIPGKEDLVEFYFSSLRLKNDNNGQAEAIVFRATFDTISDNHKPSWTSIKYMGRADPLYVYQGYERNISFGFTIHIGSRDEMKASWRKINYLASWTAPEYTGAGFIKGPLIRLNIGHLYRKMPGYLSSLSYTFDNQQGNWETAKLPEDQKSNGKFGGPGVLQLPKTIQVACDFVPVGVYRPEYNGTMYSLYDDTGVAADQPENGLIPSDKTRVNYFKTYDDGDITDVGNKAYLPVKFNEETTILEGTSPNPNELEK